MPVIAGEGRSEGREEATSRAFARLTLIYRNVRGLNALDSSAFFTLGLYEL